MPEGEERFKVLRSTVYKPWENELTALLRALTVLAKSVVAAVEQATSKEKQRR